MSSTNGLSPHSPASVTSRSSDSQLSRIALQLRDEGPPQHPGPQKKLDRIHGRRQGIFWLLTVPAGNVVLQGMSRGSLVPGVVWIRGQLERGGTTGYEHYQAVIAFDQKRSLQGVKALLGRDVHAELSRSEAANAYVCKEDTRAGDPFEFGSNPNLINRS